VIKDCCKVDANLRVVEQKPDMIVRRCLVCGARHWEMMVDPAPIMGKPA
jgi:hypothetical protein